MKRLMNLKKVRRFAAISLALTAFAFSGCNDTGDDVSKDMDATALQSGPQQCHGGHFENHGSPYVKIRSGWLKGKIVGDTTEFLGIPYAKPPVGNLRFAPPQPVKPWKGILEATEYGLACTQASNPGFPTPPNGEDCLLLNVFKPTDARTGDKLPVMVFIHGGAFIGGSGSDMQQLSEVGDVIGVSMNYRLGALGFLAHPEIDAHRRRHVPSGNDGLRDQQLALKWVKKNIRAFGGDPNNVTIFGESAGSMSTCIQMVSPSAKNLANRFIMESASCVGIMPGGFMVYNKEEVDVIGSALVDELCAGEADVMACLRALPAETLIAWGQNLGMFGPGWGPSYNPVDHFLPASPKDMIASGRYNKGEVIVGTNKNEWGIFMPQPILSIDEFNTQVDMNFGPFGVADAIKSHYVVNSDFEANNVFIRLMSDRTFRCPARTLARAISEQGSTAYLYHFEEAPAFHAFELPYVFGAMDGFPPNVESLQTTMQSYWTEFAETGDPNVSGQPVWAQYDIDSDNHMILKAVSEPGSNLAEDDCDFLNALFGI
ncbi:MAG: carboxylesterase family protein [Deltaproteobacteria bacterium]|nr:carboxylesterase family protein [Deltaproteobacteria bacterium]